MLGRGLWGSVILMLVSKNAAAEVKGEVGVATIYPVMVAGAAGVLEGPARLQFRGEVGWLGSPYVEAIDGFLYEVGAYGTGTDAENISSLVMASFHNSLTLRASLGWRPMRDYGFEVFAGYTLVALGGNLSAREAVEAVSGQSVGSTASRGEISIASTLQNFQVGVGYAWVFRERWVLRTSLEYFQTFASETHLSRTTSRGTRDLTAVSESVNAELDPIYTTWVKTPAIGVGFAYRF